MKNTKQKKYIIGLLFILLSTLLSAGNITPAAELSWPLPSFTQKQTSCLGSESQLFSQTNTST